MSISVVLYVPIGHFFGYKAVAAGAKYQEAMTRLEKRIKDEGINHDADATIQAAILELQQVLSSDFKANEIEVAIVEKDKRFRTLSEDEIDAHLTAIAERD